MTFSRNRLGLAMLTAIAMAACADDPSAPIKSSSRPQFDATPLGVTVTQVTFETRPYYAGPLSSTAATIAAWNAAPAAQPGYTNGPQVLTDLLFMSNQQFGGGNSYIAYHVVVRVHAYGNGPASFRFGADFGWGGTLLVDGVVLQERWSDMWWNNSWGDPSQYLQGTLNLTDGDHVIELYGMEGCCDGNMRGELNAGDGWVGIEQPSDVTPPVVTPSASGDEGDNDWFKGTVFVSFDVADAESPVTSTTGCEDVSISYDTGGETLNCSATSTGGTGTGSITVKRDATAPSINFAGAASYSVDQTVAVSCVATDALSGIATSTCPGAAGAAYSLGVGTHTLDAEAKDNAGNTSTASFTYTVTVNSGNICTLVQRFVSQQGIANSMCKQLQNNAIGAFVNHVEAQRGKAVSAANAATLIYLAGKL